MRIRETEMWTIVSNNDATKSAAISLHFRPGNSGLVVLDKVGDLFDNWIIHSFVATYRPACAATQTGVLGVGVDWETDDPTVKVSEVTTLKKIAVLDPHSIGACWQPFRFALPASRMQRNRIMKTAAADTSDQKRAATSFHIIGILDKGDFTAGYIEVEYDITFTGLRFA